MSDARKHWWDEISDEDLFTLKEKRSMISKKWWSNLSIDERLNISEKTSISMKKWWSSVNNEIIQARNKKIYR
jgi:hypothetical protein